MANIKSQIKRNRQNKVRHDRNKGVRSELKTRYKAVTTAAETGDAEAVDKAVRTAQRRIDQAAASGLIHRNTAARRKSRLARRLNDLQQ
jgi:small subunit ribosomal protein S20